jgi:hypothetical protein
MTAPNERKGEGGTTERVSETASQTPEVKAPVEPSALPLSPPSLDERRFLFAKEMGVADKSLKNRELDLKEAELKKPFWRDPVFLGIIAAALSVLGSLLVTALSNHNAQELARQKTNADIVTELIRNVDAATAKRNLQVAISVGLVQDPESKITDSLNKGVFLSLPPASQAQPAAPVAGIVPNNTSGTTAPIQTSEQLIAEQTIVVPNGGYALTSSPTCPTPQLEDTAGIVSAMLRNALAQSYPDLQSLAPTATKAAVSISQSSGSRGDAASCGIVAFEVPSDYKSVRAEFSAGEKDGALRPCLQQVGPSLNCDVGWAAWTWSASGTKAVATFKNWSGDRTRQARVRLIGTKEK